MTAVYLLFAPLLALLAGVGVWFALGRAGLAGLLRLLIAALAGIVLAALLYWGMIYLSVCLYVWNDPVTW